MDNCALPVAVSALACAIARELDDTDAMLLLAAVFTQLGDTLATIGAQRVMCEKYCTAASSAAVSRLGNSQG